MSPGHLVGKECFTELLYHITVTLLTLKFTSKFLFNWQGIKGFMSHKSEVVL